MIKIPRKKVAIIPIFDAKESRGGIVRAESFTQKREVTHYNIIDLNTNKKIDEAEDKHRADYLISKYYNRGIKAIYKRVKVQVEDQPLDSGERCDQGVVKYIGAEVNDVKIGDYVFFSGYTGTLVNIEGEGRLIILPENFIECTFDIDKFLSIPGLYFKAHGGSYFEATYEQAMNIMAETFTLMNMTIEVKTSRPKLEDYNVK